MGNSYSDESPPAKKNRPVTKPVVKEIIIKCSVEEMMKAFFKDYVIVWHDPNVNNQENQISFVFLKKFCEVFTFTEWEKASTFIKETKAVCHVITSGANGELLTKEISTSQNVENIYIFCGNKGYHSIWAQNYKKISCVETKIEDVLSKIQENLLGWYKEASSLKLNLPAFAPVFNDHDKGQMNSLHFYMKVIPTFKIREQAKDDFVSLSKTIYSDLKNQGFIADFEKSYNEYNKDHTLKWYTLESFLYKVTNNCLRIATSDSIQYCRLPLKDIEQAVKDQYQAKSKEFNGLLYRGAYLSQEEWSSLKENQDKEIEMHGFLSVSKEKNVALKFMRTDSSKKVFITIIVPRGQNKEEQGFAEIEEYSRYPQEKEVLFNVRSRFTVLETEDDYAYSETSRCRHLVLLYGAQGFREFAATMDPIQKVSIPSMENVSCVHCSTKIEKLLFVSIEKQDHYYCKVCIEFGVAPFLCIPSMNPVGTAKVKGCLLKMNSGPEQTPFYGYKCCNCQAKKQKIYFICADCDGGKENKWCEGCFEKGLKCKEIGHQSIILETSPFSFWCERMSKKELDHLTFERYRIQQDDNVFQQADMYFVSHKYEKAIEYYTLYIQENEGKDKDENLASSYHNIGVVYDMQKKHKKALEYFLKSLEIRKSIYGENHDSVATCYNNIGKVYNDQREYKQALEYYLKSAEILKFVRGDDDPSVAVSYNNIGSVYNDQGEYKKALEYYSKSLEIRKYVPGGDNPADFAITYNNIGKVYEKQGEYNKALEYFLESLDIYKSVYGDNHPDVAISYSNIGNVYSEQGGEHKKALECYLKSLDIYKSIYGEDNGPGIALSFQRIGMIYFDQGEYKMALEYHLKSLDTLKSIHGEDHPEVAVSYNNVGFVYFQQEEYNKALKYFLKSLDIYKSVYGDNHPSVATSYKNIGSASHKQGEDKKALEYYLKALDLYKSVYGGDNDLDIASCYYQIGKVYDSQGEYSQALESYLKYLDIKKSVYGGENHLDVATSNTDIGILCDNQGEYKKALEFYLKSLDIRKFVFGEDNHPLIASSYNDIAMVYSNQGEYKMALEYYFKALEICKSLTDNDNCLDFATSFHNIGRAYRDQGEYSMALEYFLKSLDIYKNIYGENHPHIAESYSEIGETYSDQGENEMALMFYMKCLEIEQSVFGEDHIKAVTTMYRIIKIDGLPPHLQG